MSATSTVEAGASQAPASQGSPIDRLFFAMTQLGASDLHLCGGIPADRAQGRPHDAAGCGDRSARRLTFSSKHCSRPSCLQRNRAEFAERHDTDFAYALPELGRFRANVFVDRNGPGGVFRVIPSEILTAESSACRRTPQPVHAEQGLVLVTGPTGSGKSTTLAR